MTKPAVTAFFDPATNTISYLVADPESSRAAVIDPVLDFDVGAGTFDTAGARKILAVAAASRLRITWVLETHVHADHISAAPFIAAHTGARVGISERVREVQRQFIPTFGTDDLHPDGKVFDHLFADAETFSIGALQGRALHTPGHTPACAAYVIGDAAFVGDTLFMPDFGTARADFPGGDARTLYRSIRRILALPPRRAYSSATTTRPPAAKNSPGKQPSPPNAPITSTCVTAFPNRPSSSCVKRATPPCRHRNCSTRRSR
jgi:glyoxylase-like metal-dependent hydrolase (beta-lactamase superfamily II)